MKVHIAEGLSLRHVGFLELDRFYTWLQRWFEFNGYWEDENEKSYKQTMKPGIRNIEMVWKNQKKISDLVSYHIDINFILIAISDVEMAKGDREKVKLQKGDFELRLNAYIELKDFKSKFMNRIYYALLTRHRTEEYFADLYDKFYKLHDEIKEIFDQYVK